MDRHLSRAGYELELDEAFAAPTLDGRLWLPYYLPHWSSRSASAARYAVGGGELRLRIDHDQPPWCPEYDGELRVSSLQSGLVAGPVGSALGQHRFRPEMVVREAQPALALYTPRYGLIEARARALADPANMAALWMIGLEDAPERSGEICVFEIFGRDVTPDRAGVGMGVHPFNDPGLRDDFDRPVLPIDVRAAHWYAVAWTPDEVAFYVDERLIRVVDQSPAYPMQLMLGVYEFRTGPEPPSPPERYPKEFVVERIRGWRPVSGSAARPPAWPPDR